MNKKACDAVEPTSEPFWGELEILVEQMGRLGWTVETSQKAEDGLIRIVATSPEGVVCPNTIDPLSLSGPYSKSFSETMQNWLGGLLNSALPYEHPEIHEFVGVPKMENIPEGEFDKFYTNTLTVPRPITNKDVDADLLLKPRIDDGSGEPPDPPDPPIEGRHLRDGDGEPMEFATGEAILAQQCVTLAQMLVDCARVQMNFAPTNVVETVARFQSLAQTYQSLSRRTINSSDQPVFPITGFPPHFESQTQGFINPVAGP